MFNLLVFAAFCAFGYSVLFLTVYSIDYPIVVFCLCYLGPAAKLSGKSPKKHVGMQSSESKGASKLPSRSGK